MLPSASIPLICNTRQARASCASDACSLRRKLRRPAACRPYYRARTTMHVLKAIRLSSPFNATSGSLSARSCSCISGRDAGLLTLAGCACCDSTVTPCGVDPPANKPANSPGIKIQFVDTAKALRSKCDRSFALLRMRERFTLRAVTAFVMP